jgi:hypothetical protein
MQELSEVFYSLLLTSGIAFILALARILYKSKCKSVECCGCIKIQRDIASELELDEREPPSPRAEQSQRTDNNA